MAKIIILSCKAYDFEDKEKENKRISGMKFDYTFSLEPYAEISEGIYGNDVFSGWLPYEAVSKLQTVPGVYETKTVTRKSKNDTPVEVIRDIVFDSEL